MKDLWINSGTTISARYGVKPIEDIQEGDIIITLNEKTNKQEIKKVTSIRNSAYAELVEYNFGDELKLIASFKYDVKVGDEVETSWQEIERIINIKSFPKSFYFTSYNIQVEDNNNFYANGILIHN